MPRLREEEVFTVANRGGWFELFANGHAESAVRVPSPKDHNILRIKNVYSEKLDIDFVGEHACIIKMLNLVARYLSSLNATIQPIS